MVSFVQSVVPVPRFSSKSPALVAVAIAVLVSGCSADIARFDFGSANLSDGSASTGAIPTPVEPISGRSNLIGEDDRAGYAAGTPGQQPAYQPPSSQPPAIAATPLADPTPAQPEAQYPAAQSPAAVPPQQPARVAALTPQEPAAAPPVMAEHEEVSKGQQIEVQPGDTLYGLSRRYNVSLNDLMRVNGLTGPALKPGQKLYVPSTRVVEKPVTPEPAMVAVSPADIPSDWTGTHTIAPGESLYALAVRYKTRSADIQRYNGIRDVRRLRPGQVLRVPGEPGSAPVAAAPTPQQSVAAAEAASPSAASAGGPSPTILNAPTASSPSAPTDASRTNQRVAAASPLATANDASPASSAVPATPGSGSIADTPKLRWPVEGKIISGYGRRADSTHNDGINLAVPMGADVHAAEAGTVAYAGDDLKGYGNLILVRHDNGWVTAYAHASELLVKRGDPVTRGQIIAKAGKTGQVDQPQVHFELRQGQKPVDPVPYMDKM